MGTAQLDNPVPAIAEPSADTAIVLGLRRPIVCGTIHEDADAGQAIAREVEIDLDREIGLGAVLSVVRQAEPLRR